MEAIGLKPPGCSSSSRLGLTVCLTGFVKLFLGGEGVQKRERFGCLEQETVLDPRRDVDMVIECLGVGGVATVPNNTGSESLKFEDVG